MPASFAASISIFAPQFVHFAAVNIKSPFPAVNGLSAAPIPFPLFSRKNLFPVVPIFFTKKIWVQQETGYPVSREFFYTLGKIACLQDFAVFPTASTKAARETRNSNADERNEHAFVLLFFDYIM
jgi:hypothetical protein